MAIDALQFRNFLEQFQPDRLNRELNKVVFYFCFTPYFVLFFAVVFLRSVCYDELSKVFEIRTINLGVRCGHL